MKTKEEIKQGVLENCVNDEVICQNAQLSVLISRINDKTLEFKDVFKDADLADTVGMGGWHKLYERKK